MKFKEGDKIGKRIIKKLDGDKAIMECSCGKTRSIKKTTLYAIQHGIDEHNYPGGCKSCHGRYVAKKFLGKYYEKNKRETEDKYIGKEYGNLVVLEYIRRGVGRRAFKLECPKGHVFERRTSSVKNGLTTCLECKKKRNVGNVFGKWKITRRDGRERDVECVKCGYSKTLKSKPKAETRCWNCIGLLHELDGELLTKQDIGRKFGYSRERIRQLIEKMGWEKTQKYLIEKTK